ncbi:UDP-3-O-(3-hydroxymyristoyl)glucosamine N-acyltransferase [Dongshaea marina]|uniref:UDP-3-O-(3-hydroxymyristoyl)glucosamine N-acyltransferase n=1 Tax=Dongshaea marina TaxID=2047966 RepID=UPI000D3ECD90|nr:UDP-3-O-(3-hydroxymyristoyl)glucosamine N-acyltransferase [Dongshaea marina]
MAISLQELADKLGAQLHGDGSREITQVAGLNRAGSSDLSFITSRKFREQLAQSEAAAVLLTEGDLPFCQTNALVVANPYVAYAKASQLLDTAPAIADGIHPTAVVADDVILGADVNIGANAVVEAGCVLGDRVSIGAGTVVGHNVTLGEGVKLYPNVTLYHGVSVGRMTSIHSGSVIGADGFGNANERGEWVKIIQSGSVRIGERVEIGSCTTIDRGAVDDTVIADNVVIDNQCQIAHNVEIGYGTAIAGGTIMAGSLKVGKYCMIGGASVFNGHMEICDHVNITGMAMVMRPITEPGTYSSGIPLQTNQQWRRTAARVLKIEEMHKRLNQLAKQVEQD